MAIGASGAAVAAASAAADAERARQQEEEEMTAYEPADVSQGWEFKILRSARSEFKNRDRLQEILREEAQAGWTLVEKFDDARIRLKRPVGAQRNDTALGFDPYRTYFGRSEKEYTLLILGWTLGLLAGVFLLIMVLLAIIR